MSDTIQPLNFPTDRDRSGVEDKDYVSGRLSIGLAADSSDELDDIASSTPATVIAVLVSAFGVLLYRLTNQADPIIGISVDRADVLAQSPRPAPLQLAVAVTSPFRALLSAAATSLQAVLPPKATLDAGASVVMDTLDLTFSVRRSDGGFEIACEYNARLFDVTTIQRWLESYRQLLTGLRSRADLPVTSLPWVSDIDLQQIGEWNHTTVDVPVTCVHLLVEAQVRQTPQAVAAEFAGRSITYEELNRRANQLARRLRNLGVGRNTLVGLCLDRSIEMLVGLLSVLKAGGAYVPLDPAYPAERLGFMITDSAMSVIVAERGLQMPPVPPGVEVLFIDTPSLAGEEDHDLPKDTASAIPDSIAYVIYTSGSTGVPKGVRVPHRCAVNLLSSVARTPGLTGADVVLALTTLSFDIAVSELLLPLTVGARIVIVPRALISDGAELLRLIRQRGITFVDATPSTWRLLIDAGWSGSDGLTAICTGEAMPRDLARELVARAGRVWNGYGPTETTVWSTFWNVQQPVDRVLIGVPVANTRVYVLDEQRKPVAIGVPGELYIAGAGVTDGYLNRPELTSDRFLVDPFDPSGATMYRTGDLGRYLNNGQLECLGRTDDQVKVRGFRIELGEIEDVLSRHADVTRAAVSAREDRPGDRRLVAYVVLREGTSPSDIALRRHVSRALPHYMIPAAFVRLDAMPLTPSGKVERKALPPPSETRDDSGTLVAPRTATEALLAALWKHVLGLEQVGITEDFFSLGGHSLTASQVLARLRRDHGIDVAFRTFFEAPTIASLAAGIDAAPAVAARADRSIPHHADEGPRPLSVSQERMWLLEMMDTHQQVVHNMPGAWRLSGRLDLSALNRSLAAIVARHGMLRSRVVVRQGMPFQELDPTATVPLASLDLRNRPAAEREAAVRDFFQREIAAPQNIAAAPLFRATLIRLDENEHVLFVLPHNLIWDGWSFEIWLRELSVLYAAFVHGAPSPLPPLAISYADFAEWQREWLNGAESAEQRVWWGRQLAGDLPVLEIPSDFPRPAELTRAAAHVQDSFSPDEIAALMGVAREGNTTLFTVMFTAFCVLLHRTSGQDEVLVGTPVRARTRPETEDVLGPFMNMLVLRSRVDRRDTFVDFLARQRDLTLNAFSHQELSLEGIDVRAPILRAFFTYQTVRDRPREFGGLEVQQLAVMPATADADFRLELVETTDALAATLTCSRDLFEVATMTRFLGRFRTLVADLARNPRKEVAQLELLPREERARIGELGATPADPSGAIPVDLRFERQAQLTPTAVAIVEGELHIDYGELKRRADTLAARLRRAGIGAGSRVAVFLNRSADLVAALLGLMKSGATFTCLDPHDPPSRIVAILRDSHATMALTTKQLRHRLPDDGPLTLIVDECLSDSDPAPPTSPAADGVASLIYASNEDGVLLGAPLAHRELANAAHSLTQTLAMTGEDVVLATLPPSLDSSVVELIAPLTVGARLVIAADGVVDDPELLGEAARCATVVVASTMHWRAVITASPHSWPSLKLVCIGSLPDAELKVELTSRAAAVWMFHGFPEAGIWSTCHQLQVGEPAGLLGRTLPGACVRILDENQRDVPIGIVGELCVGVTDKALASAVERGDERFVIPAEGPWAAVYRTGERARWNSDGGLEQIQGRPNEANVLGFRVELDEIASVLREHRSIADAAVVMQSRGLGPGRLVAYVVPQAGHAYTNTELRKHLKHSLPSRSVPRAFIEVDEVPRAKSGELEVSCLQFESPTDDYEPPHSTMEVLLAREWGAALKIERVSVHDNFFELGGHSLLCFQVLERVERDIGRRISPRLMLLDSLRQIATRLERESSQSTERAPQGEVDIAETTGISPTS